MFALYSSNSSMVLPLPPAGRTISAVLCKIKPREWLAHTILILCFSCFILWPTAPSRSSWFALVSSRQGPPKAKRHKCVVRFLRPQPATYLGADGEQHVVPPESLLPFWVELSASSQGSARGVTTRLVYMVMRDANEQVGKGYLFASPRHSVGVLCALRTFCPATCNHPTILHDLLAPRQSQHRESTEDTTHRWSSRREAFRGSVTR